ncbi:uncharacterized protein ColSpa_01413 [Colletotrichum spaethianum]|uniref:EC8 protein n=1 Tax=Colletotrichum spaethianum TaxID=700344 RepID=A0AA37LBC9_9PEZI|nr:uncharacterized protein ColSpa_01413 [Colletotrichum spaethianum]GKT41232.1 hypothetical protein ColSpa_01413 [Colletotrichum spaethianum]
MVSFKNFLIATLVSSVIATPIQSPDSTDNDLEIVKKVPVIESRDKDYYRAPSTTNGGVGNGYNNGYSTSGGGDCNYSEKQRLDQEIQNRYQEKDRLDSEIKKREAMKDQLDQQIRQKQGECH